MHTDEASLPYSKKTLEALARTLKIHRALVWVNPVTNNISLKTIDRTTNLQVSQVNSES